MLKLFCWRWMAGGMFLAKIFFPLVDGLLAITAITILMMHDPQVDKFIVLNIWVIMGYSRNFFLHEGTNLVCNMNSNMMGYGVL